MNGKTRNEVLDMRLDGVIVDRMLSVKIDETGTQKEDPSYKLNIAIDMDGWTVEQVLDLAVKTLTISFQKVLRECNVKQVMEYNGKTVRASDMGKKPSGSIDVIAAFKAKYRNASPEARAELLKELQELV